MSRYTRQDAAEPLTAAEVVDELTERGYGRDQAQAMIRGYLDDMTARIGAPVYQWGLDSHDVAEIVSSYDALPERRADVDGWFSGGYDAAHSAHLDALARADVAEPAHGHDAGDNTGVAAGVRGDATPTAVLVGRARDAVAAAAADAAVDSVAQRQAQLTTWHTDAQAAETAAGADARQGWER